MTLCTVASPIVTLIVQARQRRREKLDDYARQDMVAAKVESVADELASVTKNASEQRTRLGDKVDKIHALVNSNLTAQMQLTLNALQAQFDAMNEVIATRRELGHEPSDEALAALKRLEEDIVSQKLILAERHKKETPPD